MPLWVVSVNQEGVAAMELPVKREGPPLTFRWTLVFPASSKDVPEISLIRTPAMAARGALGVRVATAKTGQTAGPLWEAPSTTPELSIFREAPFRGTLLPEARVDLGVQGVREVTVALAGLALTIRCWQS
jgi:hypothetical protein